eukprot:15460149-Alexandrium_andersonii.AAC.1
MSWAALSGQLKSAAKQRTWRERCSRPGPLREKSGRRSARCALRPERRRRRRDTRASGYSLRGPLMSVRAPGELPG